MLFLGPIKSLSSPRCKLMAQHYNVQSRVWFHSAIQAPIIRCVLLLPDRRRGRRAVGQDWRDRFARRLRPDHKRDQSPRQPTAAGHPGTDRSRSHRGKVRLGRIARWKMQSESVWPDIVKYIGDILSYTKYLRLFEKYHLTSKKCSAKFWATFYSNIWSQLSFGQLFIPKSGHSDHN